LEGVVELILFTFCILDPDVMSFRHDPLVGIDILYLAINSQTLNRCRVLKWLTIIKQPILEFDNYTGYECIPIMSDHEPTNFVAPGDFNLQME
jgi:hypothetical protein